MVSCSVRWRRLSACVVFSALLLSAAPQRIVSTAPSVTEMLYALGLGDRVAGVTNYCRYPPEARLKPKIGGYSSPNLEAIAALKPDLVIIPSNPIRLADRLNALHLRTLEINQDSIAALYGSIRMVGDAAEAPTQAARLIDSIRMGLGQVQTRAAALPRTRVLFVVGRTPNRLDGLIVASKNSHIGELLEIAGGQNIFSDTRAAYPSVSIEEVLARNPEVIIDMAGDVGESGQLTDAQKQQVVSLWARRGTVSAVKQHRVFAVAPDLYAIPGPRVVQGAQSLLEMLHP
jgi:ABC-type Fe3+-hydroxamate transport system substrate-binding protein